MAIPQRDENVFYRHPILSAIVFTLLVGGAFVAALYQSATSHN